MKTLSFIFIALALICCAVCFVRHQSIEGMLWLVLAQLFLMDAKYDLDAKNGL